jgi:O-antigen/teichoic acid export membrane protein
MNISLNKIFLYFSTIVLGQLVSFLLLPIITKNVNPQIYGIYALTLTIFNFIGVFGSSWIRNISFRLYFDEKNKKNTKSFFVNSALFQFLVILILILTIIPLIQNSYFKFGSATLLITAGVSIIFGDFFSMTVDLLRAEDLPKEFALSQVVYSLVRLSSIGLGLWIGFKSPTFLFGCIAFSGFVSGLFAIFYLKDKLTGKIYFEKSSIYEITCLGLVSIPASVGGWVLALSDRVVLKIFTDFKTVGIYSVGYSLADRIVGGVASATFMMAWPTILEEWRQNGEEGATEAIHKAIKVYIWLTLGPLLAIVGYCDEITSILTSSEYISASKIIPVVALGCWINGLKKYISRPLELNKNYKFMSLITIIAAGTNLGLNFLLIPLMGAMGAAISTLVAFSLSFIIFCFFTNRKMIKFPWATFFVSLIFAIGALFVSMQFKPIFFEFTIFCIIYGVGIFVFTYPKKN